MSSTSILGSYAPINLTNKGGINSGLSTQYNNNQNLISGTQANRNTEANATLGGYQSLINGGGYTPEEKANIQNSTLGGIQSSYGSSADQASRRAAVTGNSAGFGSFMGSLARNKARDLSQGALQVQSQFANQALQQKLQGLQGLSQMYGVDTSFLNSLNNSQNSLINTGSGVQSRSRGVLGTIAGALSLPSELFGGGSNSAFSGAKSALGY